MLLAILFLFVPTLPCFLWVFITKLLPAYQEASRRPGTSSSKDPSDEPSVRLLLFTGLLVYPLILTVIIALFLALGWDSVTDWELEETVSWAAFGVGVSVAGGLLGVGMLFSAFPELLFPGPGKETGGDGQVPRAGEESREQDKPAKEKPGEGTLAQTLMFSALPLNSPIYSVIVVILFYLKLGIVGGGTS